MLLEELILKNVLKFKHGDDTYILLEKLTEAQLEEIQIKNVCAKLHVDLANRLDEVCGVLDMTRRQFIEAAIIDGISKFDQLSSDYDMFEQAYQKAGRKPREDKQ
jgi:predicted transcriptional regulator